jgi:pyruvate dehydrogenase E1 component alpha subunit
MKFSKEQLLNMYSEIVRSRVLGEKIVEYIFSGKIAGAIHPCLGQEAVSAGIISAFEISDIKTHGSATHRSQTVMAYRTGFKPFIAELLGRNGGVNNGISGEYHITDLENGLFPATGALGGTWGIGAGYAWAIKNEMRKREVVVVPYGDGAISEGATYEAMNIAALYELPIVFFIENNGIAMSTPVDKQSPLKNLADRAVAFGMPGVTVDGNDPEAVASALLDAMELAADNKPNVLEVKTHRWQGHFVGDMQGYRDTSYLQNLDQIDPVLHFEKKLRDLGYIDDEYVTAIKAERTNEIESAFEEGLQQGVATREQVLDYSRIYSNDAGGEL